MSTPPKKLASVHLMPFLARDVSAVRAVALRTGMKAVWKDDRKQRAALVAQGLPVPMGVIIRNSQGEWL